VAIFDQYGNEIPSTRGMTPYDVSDPMVRAVWSRSLAAEVQRPGMFDGPRLLDAHGKPATEAFRGARNAQFVGIILNGKILGPETDRG
jgi:hypothetical protein